MRWRGPSGSRQAPPNPDTFGSRDSYYALLAHHGINAGACSETTETTA
jgi:hypothetical protein